MKKNKTLIEFSKKFLKEIKNHEYVIIFHHVRPDGDCLGSQHGLKLWLKQIFPDKKILAIGSNEKLFNFMNFEFDEIPNDEILKEAIGIVVDANYANRIKYGELIVDKKIKTLIRIDHHPEQDDIDYKLRFVDANYCASAEQISDLIKHCNKNKVIDKNIAEFLYLGIYTDSGRFFYDYTSSRTHEIAAWLLKSGFDFFQLHKNLSTRTISDIEFNKFVLSKYKTYKNVIYCYISQKDMNNLNVDDATSNRVDFLANIEGYNIWIFFIEGKDGKIRVRLRSSEKNIAQIAREYNGGGHEKAAGAIIDSINLIDEIVQKSSEL